MRIKFLSLIAGFLVLSVAVSSCLDSDNNYELSSDDIITAFEMDTIYGVKYKFTIDHIKGEIYNVDSVPYSADTIIDKIWLQATTNGYITAGKVETEDTLYYHIMPGVKDSINVLGFMDEPLVVRVRSYDGEYKRQYKIEVRRHKSDPDSLVWGGSDQVVNSTSFSGGAVLASQETKTVSLGNKVLVYTSNGTDIMVYEGPAIDDATPWMSTLTDLPLNTKLSSILAFQENLYAVSADGQIYSSANGSVWSVAATDGTIAETLLTSFHDTDSQNNPLDFISGITTYQEDLDADEIMETIRRFATASLESGVLTWKKGGIVPDDFPVENVSGIKSYKTNTGMQRAVIIGKPIDPEAEKTRPWFSTDGLTWAPMESTLRYSIPAMNHPSIIYYGGLYYAFGDGDFTTIWKSINGIVWEKVTRRFLFPSDPDTGEGLFEGRTGYSMTIDANNRIWMTWGKGSENEDEVWSAYLNKLGFLIQ